MAPLTQPAPKPLPVSGRTKAAAPLSSVERGMDQGPIPAREDDGTAQLLKWGGWTLATGLVCALLTRTVFGGIGPQGPHTNTGWMALIITMMCLPFGFLLSLLGILKWLRKRRARP